MVLTRGDEFPIHQTPEPIAYSGTDRNFYDRYFFNGYGPDGSDFFAVAFGIYPNLDVADAHFCVIRNEVQHCLHASCELGMERLALKIGPIRIEVLEPLERLRIVVDESEGIAADITFEARAFPIEEPRFIHRFGPRTFMDYTRMTQNGRYEGSIRVDGERRTLHDACQGTRDRSWGVRPIGARDPQPMPGITAPTFFWQWTPINLPGGSLFFHLNADPDGTPWNTRAAWVADGGTAGDIVEGHGQLRSELQEETRWPSAGTLTLDLAEGPREVRFKMIERFQMRGLGYTSADWGHGMHHGPLRTERENIVLSEVAPLDMQNLHVQMVCAVRDEQGAEGMGVFEQLVLGPYAPLDLTKYI